MFLQQFLVSSKRTVLRMLSYFSFHFLGKEVRKCSETCVIVNDNDKTYRSTNFVERISELTRKIIVITVQNFHRRHVPCEL